MRTIKFVGFLLLAFAWGSASADCYHDGKKYKTGERVGAYVCTADGTWQKG